MISTYMSQSRFFADDEQIAFPRLCATMPWPVFRQDCWDLSSLRKGNRQRNVRLHFDDIAPPLRCQAKELMAYVLLGRGRLTGSKTKRPDAGTVYGYLAALKTLYRFMARHGVTRTTDLTHSLAATFHRELIQAGLAASVIAHHLSIFTLLWEARGHLTGGGFEYVPFNGLSPSRVAGQQVPDETLTPTLPETVLRWLLGNAMAYIDSFADEIIDGIAVAKRHALARKELEGRPYRRKWLERFLNELQSRGEPLPGHMYQGRLVVDLTEIARRIGCCRLSLEKSPPKLMILAAQERLGLQEYRPAKVTRCAAGYTVPWRADMSMRDIELERRNLLVAAYIVIASLTGMRDSELQELRRGCLKPDPTSPSSDAWLIHATILKGSTRGRSHNWVAIEPVAKALQVLERASSAAGESEFLFAKSNWLRQAPTVFTSKSNEYIMKFVQHVDKLAAAITPATIMDLSPHAFTLRQLPPTFEETRVSTRQFRKTLAQSFRDAPFGMVAAAIQFGHACLRTTQQYTGAERQGLNLESTATRLVCEVPPLSLKPLSEATAAEIDEREHSLVGVVPIVPGRVVDAAGFKRLMLSKNESLHIVVCHGDVLAAFHIMPTGTNP